MAEKLYALAESMTKVRNTKLFDGLVKASGKAFVILFILSGVQFLNGLLPTNLRFTLLEDSISKIYALVPLFIAYYFGSSIKNRTLGIISVISCMLLFQDSFRASNAIVAFIVTLIVSMIYVAVEYGLSKIAFPKAIPSSALDVILEWLSNIITTAVMVLIISIMPNMSFLDTLAQWILVIGVSPIFYFAIIILSGLFWTVGLHGDRLTGPFFETFLFIALFQNLIGMDGSHIINSSFHIVFASGSGSGITLSLALAILLFSKRKEDKSLVKDNVVSGMFNINEGIVFGLPIVDSKNYVVPFMLAPIVASAYGYIMTLTNVIDPFIYAIPWVTPPLVKSFVASGGKLVPVLVELGSYLLCTLVYAPFVLKANKEKDDE